MDHIIDKETCMVPMPSFVILPSSLHTNSPPPVASTVKCAKRTRAVTWQEIGSAYSAAKIQGDKPKMKKIESGDFNPRIQRQNEKQFKLLVSALDPPVLADFQKILNGDFDPDFGMNVKGSILHILTKMSFPGVANYINAVLDTGKANIYVKNGGRCALHEAASKGYFEALKTLVDRGADLGVLDDLGRTALHWVVCRKWEDENSHLKCLEYLLGKVTEEQLNILDFKGYSAIHLALKNRTAVDLILMKGKDLALQLDDFFAMNYKGVLTTARDALLDAFPDIHDTLPPSTPVVDLDVSRLYQLLRRKEEDRFLVEFQKAQTLRPLTAKYGLASLLHIASYTGLTTALTLLLDSDADPNINFGGRTPLEHCVIWGKIIPVNLILPKCNKDTKIKVFHKVCISKEHRSEQILQIILEDNDVDVINSRDAFGNTVLYKALINGDRKFVNMLNEKGAVIGAGFTFDVVESIPSKMLNDVLDSKVSIDNWDSYKIKLDLHFLLPSVDEQKRFKDDSLLHQLAMTRHSELKRLVGHPVINAYISIRWKHIQLFSYFNPVFYFIFCLLLTRYILIDNKTFNTDQLESSALGILLGNDTLPETAENTSYSSISNNTFPDTVEDQLEHAIHSVQTHQVFILLFTVIICIREIIQFVVQPGIYISNWENWLELLQVAVTVTLVVMDLEGQFNSSPVSRPTLSAIAVLATWFSFMLHIGKHPFSCAQVEMFITVSKNFIYSLSTYIILVIAFAISFLALFRDCTDNCKEENNFTDLGSSLLKIVVMFTGEFNAGDIPFHPYISTGHFVFMGFLFFVSIVLLNLLTGLAVADTRTMLDDAYLVSRIARIRLIIFFDKLLQYNLFFKFFQLCLYQSPEFDPSIVVDSRDRRVKLKHFYENDIKYYVLDKETLESAWSILKSDLPEIETETTYFITKKSLIRVKEMMSNKSRMKRVGRKAFTRANEKSEILGIIDNILLQSSVQIKVV